MTNLDDYFTLKRRADRLKQKAAEAEGQYKEMIRRLKEDFGCATLEEAEKLLTKLEKEEEALRESYLKLYAKFKKRWGHVLEEEDREAPRKTESREGGSEKRKDNPR